MSLADLSNTHRSRYALLIRYGISGGTGAVIQTLLLYVWISILGLTAYYIWGVVISFICAASVSFILQKFWTFAGREHHHRTQLQLMLYMIVGACGLVLNTLLAFMSKELFEWLGLNYFHVWYLVTQIVIILIVAATNFTANYFVTFRKKVL